MNWEGGGEQQRKRGQLTGLNEDLHGGRCTGMWFVVLVDVEASRECERWTVCERV